MGPKKVDSMQREIDALHKRQGELESSLKAVEDRLVDKSNQFDKIEQDLHQMKQKFQSLVQWLHQIPRSMPQSILSSVLQVQPELETTKTMLTVARELPQNQGVKASKQVSSEPSLSDSTRKSRSLLQLTQSTGPKLSTVPTNKTTKNIPSETVPQHVSTTPGGRLLRNQRLRIIQTETVPVNAELTQHLNKETSSKPLKTYTRKESQPEPVASTSISPLKYLKKHDSEEELELECMDNETTEEDQLTKDPLETTDVSMSLPSIDLIEIPEPSNSSGKLNIENGVIHKVRRNRPHVSSWKNKNEFKCSVCGNQYSARSGLARHMNNHTRRVEYPCQHCSIVFLRKDRLNIHQQSRRCRGSKVHKGAPGKIKLDFPGINFYT